MIRCYNPVEVRCRKKSIFLVFSERKFWKVKRTFLTPSRQPLNPEIWPAYCQIVFLENRVGDFCFLFPFSNNRHFFKGSADDLSPLTLSYCHKRTNAHIKNRRHSFLVERVKKQM